MYQINRDAPFTDGPEEKKSYTCPECGDECTEFFLNEYGEIVGCDCCIHSLSCEEYYANLF